MTTENVLKRFLEGYTTGKASSLHIDGDCLVNYYTTIAQRINGVIHINITKYSMTTSKHQNRIRRELPNAPTVSGVPRGVRDLSSHIFNQITQ